MSASAPLDHERFVRVAIEEAASARDSGNPPFGAVLEDEAASVFDLA